jgi:hypothetical protein
MLDTETTCRWRLLCYQREADIIEREHLLELSQRIDQQLGPCHTCQLQVVRLKGSTALTHIVPVLPVETRTERAATANRHQPRTNRYAGGILHPNRSVQWSQDAK